MARGTDNIQEYKPLPIELMSSNGIRTQAEIFVGSLELLEFKQNITIEMRKDPHNRSRYNEVVSLFTTSLFGSGFNIKVRKAKEEAAGLISDAISEAQNNFDLIYRVESALIKGVSAYEDLTFEQKIKEKEHLSSLYLQVQELKGYRDRYYEAQEAKNTGSIHIYFLEDPLSNRIKIGKTVDIKNRISNLQGEVNKHRVLAGQPVTELRLIGSLKVPKNKGHQLEQDLHRKFNDYRVAGEWFEFSSEIKDYLEKYKSKLN